MKKKLFVPYVDFLAQFVECKEEVLRGLRKGLVKKVFLSSNCQPQIKSDILHYSKLAGTEVVELSLNNEELGVLCKKGYFVSVAGILDA